MTATRMGVVAVTLWCVGAAASHAQAVRQSAAPSPAGELQRASAARPAAGTIFLYPERIRLENGDFAMAERGMMFVPVNRTRADSEVIGIEVYRFRATAAARSETPPIFRLPGGPNFRGLESSLAGRGYFEREIAPYLEIADYVVVGQRGIGTSKPTTTCAPPAAVALNATPEQRAEAHRTAAAACKAFWEQQGLDLSGLNVIEAAADVDDVRAALGYRTIQISGGSFGSHWGLAVMRYYPTTVTRALLHGLEGPDHTYDMPSGILNSLANIAAEADTAAALRGHIPAGGLLHALRTTIERLDRAPVLVTVEDEGRRESVRVDGDAIRAVARGYAGGPAGWPANVLALYHGDYSGAARAAIRARRQPGYPPASYFMLDCGSGISSSRLAIMDADSAVAMVGDIEWSYRVNCPVWGADLGDAFRANFVSSIPTLFLHGDRDLSTPLANALELHPYFSNSHFVLVRGGSHGALSEAMRTFPEFRQRILHFFATGEMRGLPAEIVMPPVPWIVPARNSAGEG
jgi:pimeloyl-ACP methyl ester carboxylesterase